MFGTIRKHQKWLWAFIITVIIFSFVIFFSPYSRVSDTSRGGNYGSIEGQKITRDRMMNAEREVYLRHFFSTGRWPDEEARRSGFDAFREAYQWLFLVKKQEDMDIHIGTEQVAQFAREMIRPFERRGITSPKQFIDQVLMQQGMDAADFERFVRHYLGVQEMIAAVGISGRFVTPAETQALYIRENQELATEAVFFQASNYLAQVSITPEAIAQFYSNRLANYRIPERVQVNYLKFDLTNFNAQAEAELSKTNINEIIDENYRRLGSNYFADAKSPEQAKAKIRDEILKTRAMIFARRAAAEFATPLFELEPVKVENFEKVAREKGLKVQTSKPFDREIGPEGLAVGPEFAKAAFSRTDEEPFSPPILGEDGVYLLATIKRYPSENPPLDQVRDKVTVDYRYSQALNLARQAGFAFQSAVTNALAQGKSFDEAAKNAKLTPVTLPPFSLSTRALGEVEENINLNQLKQLAFGAEVGKTSPFQMTADGGVLVFVKAKLPVDETKMKADLSSFVSYVRQSRQNEAFNDWFRREAEKALQDTPIAQTQQQQKQPALPGAPKAPVAPKAPATK